MTLRCASGCGCTPQRGHGSSYTPSDGLECRTPTPPTGRRSGFLTGLMKWKACCNSGTQPIRILPGCLQEAEDRNSPRQPAQHTASRCSGTAWRPGYHESDSVGKAGTQSGT